MIPAPFTYHAPTSLRDAVALLRRHAGDAKVLAGGMSLVPMMRFRLVQPEHVVDVSRLKELAYIRRDGDAIAIGAGTTYRQIETSALLRRAIPAIPAAVDLIADLQVRNRGTIGGSLAHADPAADLPALVLALDGQIEVVGGPRRRRIAASRFFVDSYTTALEETEILREVRLPTPPRRTGGAYVKFANHTSRFAIVGVAAFVTADRRGVAGRVRVAVTGAGPVPARARGVERGLTGKPLAAHAIDRAAERASDGVDFTEDQYGSKDYRAHLTRVLTARALREAANRAGVVVS